ncbi:MAG: alpha/beta fold hydrolase [Phycisphaerae bacterium]|nr:alpha/beta fold hydrolase [Phycisphaerae bacterium]
MFTIACASLAAVLLVDPPAAPSSVAAPSVVSPAQAGLSAPWIGRWQGSIESKIPEPAPGTALPKNAQVGSLFCLVDVAAGVNETEVVITAPQAGAMKTRGKGVIASERSLAFTLDAGGASGRFRGEVSADGTTFAGTLQLGRPGTELTEVPFSLVRTPDPKKAPKSVRWEGVLDTGPMKLPMSYTIAELLPDSYAGVVDIPLQNLEGFPVLVTKSAGDDGSPRWTFKLPVGGDATLDLAQSDADTLRGKFRQGGGELPIELKKVVGASTVAIKRPQLPQPPFPYRSEDVLIKHRFGHSLAGTLTIPERTPLSPEKFPAVVLVSGSGPQDRDETLFAHKPFFVIADALTRAGIAVLRYDDRGIGSSTGTFARATSLDFAVDADEATEWLKQRNEIDPRKIGIIGHSEGGLIAPIVARWQWDNELGSPTPIAFIALIAGPGVSGGEVLKVQQRRLLEANGTAEADVVAICDAQAAVLDLAVVKDGSRDDLRTAARKLVALQIRAGEKPGQPHADDAAIDEATAAAVAQLRNPWMIEFLKLDPRDWISRLRIPVLAMNGSLDTQVDMEQNIPAIEASARLGGAPLTVKRYTGLNHLFQPATTGAVEEYQSIETTFDPTALKDLVDWIVARGNEPPPALRAASDSVAVPAKRPDAPDAPSVPSPVPAPAAAPTKPGTL